MNQKNLIQKIKSGDKNAFNHFYKSSKPKLLSYIKSRVKNQKDAQELTQDTYLSFLDSLPLFRGESKLTTFLYSIARHEISDYWRKKYAKKAILTIPFMDQLYTQKLYSTAVLNNQIQNVYQKLNQDYVIILKLKYEKGYSIIQISKILNLTRKAAESKLYRARVAFQQVYIELYGI